MQDLSSQFDIWQFLYGDSSVSIEEEEVTSDDTAFTRVIVGSVCGCVALVILVTAVSLVST